jgi:hypothetical protein
MGKTIHSSGQMEHHKVDICDKSRVVGGKQRIVTLEGHAIPLHIRDGLPYMDMTPPSDQDLIDYVHVPLTSDMDWDPAVLDNEIAIDEWKDAIHQDEALDDFGDTRVKVDGSYAKRVIATFTWLLSSTTILGAFATILSAFEGQRSSNDLVSGQLTTEKVPPDLEALQSKLGFAPLNVIATTLDNTTQFYRNVEVRTPMRDHRRSRCPAANVKRRNEPVSTDWIYSDTPAIDSGANGAQIFIGTKTLFCSAYGAKTDKQFVNHLEDEI